MALSPKIAMSDDFLKSFARIPRQNQQAVLTFVAKFRQNPLASGINYERINDAADANMRSVRINDNLRGIILKPETGDVYCLLWVDRHDDAYQWARRHRVAIHPDVGSLQVYAVDRKSTRLNSSHVKNSYAVFCLKKKIKSPQMKVEAADQSKE